MATKKAPVEKQSKKSTGKGGARPGAGRPKGSLDKGNALIREMIVQALDEAGGVQYLKTTATSHPAAFLALIGKVMPVQVEGGPGAPMQHQHKHELSDDALAAIAAQAR